VRQRLLNLARAQERPFQELLQYYAMERFLYRRSIIRGKLAGRGQSEDQFKVRHGTVRLEMPLGRLVPTISARVP